ncbi:MAG: hypothetical protein UV42_C0006G0012 [Candidatus Magasanikbacteria bacterium GW2011_GWE2_42_7]|uniref:Uncharacterized protein n=1 Tax=Candidatus Magasanikbacteria bacterium GW2011_GWE2_42_7 TaxID=1619052 RepID=A0A0G1BH17_9BACT|nr:MAG: hypothetical protein UV42_C0006G0012 [Candidatus Magasanikbacteria bacterium GW2011_GWE2_42_7]
MWTLTVDPLTSIDEPISIGTSWREYVVGPVTFTGNTIDPVSLVFDRSSSATAGIYFIDNVSLMRTEGNVYLIRDSWKTPEGYDAPTKCFGEGQNPAGPYPGAALGCDAYTTSLGQKAYATGFDRLCREKAVGCAPLWDTYNTESTYAEVYNARCTNGRDLANGLVADVSVAVATTCEITVDTIDTYSCTIAPRESSCVIAGPIRVPSDAFLGGPYGDEGYLRIKASADEAVGTGLTKSIVMVDASSVYIPADTPVLDPVFLTDNQESACLEKYVGCQAVAIEEQTTPVAGQSNGFTYHPQMIRNNPASYLGEQGTLCTQEQLACSAYTTSNGANTYFKDPAVNANKLCSYIAPDPTNEASVGGWFLTSVGTCTNNPDIQCTTNAICGDGNTCTGIGKSVPCYENYKEDFSTYGLWSNGSDGYDGYVGECPVGQNLCTELVDPYDTDTSGKNPDGKPYYVIFDTQLTASVGECQGKASLREGCVLFDNTNIPNKSYDASATYAAGEALAKTGDTLVVPQSTDENDANVLLKVERNRECSEWIACRSYEPITLPNGQQSLLCSQLAACLEYQGTNCIKLAPVDDTRSPSEKFLDIDAYINRDTSWNGIEYTGYSLFNRYDIAEYSSVNMPQNISPSDGIVDTVNSYLGYALSEEYVEQHPEEHACATGESKSACGPDDTGRCISGTCVLPVDGVFQSSDITLDKIANTLGNAECKVPPQEDAPFPGDIVPNFDTPNARDVHGFAQKIVNTTITRRTFSQRQNNANVCQDGDDCSCNYVAVTYGSLATDYWDTDVYDEQGDNLRLWGICTGASGTEGDYCKEDAECGVGGSCQKISHLATFVGSTGHCLEYDLSRPVLSPEGQPRYACLTWYPSDKSFGNIDTSNLFQDAGYNPGIDAFTGDGGTGGQVYCTQSFGRGAATYEGTLRIHPRYGGGEITNAQVINGVGGVTLADMWEDPETQWHWSGVPGDGDRQLKTIRPTETTPQNQIVQCSQALTVSDMFTIDNDAWVMEYLYTKYYNPRLLDFFRNIRPALQDPDEIARQQYSEILDRIALNGCTDMYGNPYSPVEMDGNPYWWYVCGAKYAGQTFGSDDSSTCSAQSTGSYTVDESLNALYSLVTLFSWYTLAPSPGALNTNAVVLRVEGDYNGNNFGSSPQGNNAYKVGALVPVASEFDSAVDASTLNFDTGTMMHPPRFGANNAIYSFTNFKVSTASNPPAVSLNTTCLAAGGCSSAENTSLLFQSTVTEKNLNRNALRSVYFVPFRIPVRNALGPAPLTEELKINFNGYGDLGVNGSVLTSDGTMTPWYPSSDPYLPPESYPKKTTKRSITTYELVRTPSSTVNCEGLVSYCDYGGSGDDSEVHTQYALSPGNPSVGEVRNQVHYRSVMVFYKSEGGTNTPSFVQESDGPFVKAVSPETDPFSIACNATKGNFFAIGMDFNKNGEFLGYITRNCGSYGLQLGVVATMNDQCSEFVSVYQDVGATGQSNKAWTDRVWKESNYQLLGQSAFGHDVSRAPFGSTDLSASDLLGISNDVDKQGNLLKYAFMSEGATGYPYYCRAASELNIKVFAKTALEMCDTLTQNGYSTTAIQSIANWMNSSSITSGRDVLLSLFGAYYVRAVFPFDSVQPGGDIHEINPILAAGLQPPKIYSLNPETCFPSVLTSSQLSTQCSAGSLNNLSVGFNDDDAQIVSKVIYQARARFFGFADDDRMPIRRVLVDWGDGTITNKGLTGMYKNRKPYCEESNSPGDTSEVGYCKDSFTNTPTSLTCKADQDCPTGYACTDYSLPAFGNLPRACETGPFDYAHTYGCDSPNQTVGQIRDQISEQTYNTLLQSGLNDDSPLCVYQPRVQILDNWGYCNGTCNGEGTPGCYNSSSDFGEKQCDNPQFDDVHWTTYQGLIIITP